MKSFKPLFILFLLFILFSLTYAQNNGPEITKTDTFKINLENKYELSSVYIIPFSETVKINTKKINNDDYSIDLTRNIISLSDSLSYTIFDTVFVQYETINLNLRKSYRNRSLVKYYDTQLNEYVGKVKTESVDLSTKAIFGKDLNSSGTLLRGFTFGTNKDLTVNSGLRLQLSGKISDDIEIVAALTDENTPIQPEGNTERLEELDKVFIQIKHSNADATFGDFNLQQSIGEFGKIERKLQGVIGNVKFQNYGGSFSFATSKGKFNSMQFNGTDGVQGPYRLTGINGENDIIVIAGSEKIYLDGRELKRGENNDYTIEYSNGEVTFTPKILITSLSRITVDYEYTDRQYARNAIGANASANLFDKMLNIKINAYQEGDNKNSPIDFSLTNNEEKILRQSGDNPLLAAQSGVTELQGDSLGIYSAADTLIDGSQITIYRYAPGSANSHYNVTFSYVGQNKGNYKRESIGKFIFVGIGKGGYLPIKLLPLPEKKQLGNIVVNYTPVDKVNLNVEFAASSFDKNTLSDLDDNDNNGFARNIKLKFEPMNLNIFSTNLGNFSGSLRDRYLDNKFKSIDRINNVEFERDYNTSTSSNKAESLREYQLNYKPVENIDFTGQYGKLKKGDGFSSERIYGKTDWLNYKSFDVNYIYDYVNTKNLGQSSNWLKQEGNIAYSFWNLKPGFNFRSEDKKDKAINTDSLISSSLKYYEYSPFLLLNLSGQLSFSAKYTFTNEFLPLNGIFVNESKAYTHTYSINWREFKEFSTNLDFSFRRKKYSPTFIKKGLGNNESILIRSHSNIDLFNRFIFGNIYYQAASERTAKLEKVFVKVVPGTGSYSYQGDLNKNGIADESEYIIDPYEGDYILTTLPTDELYPVIDLKVNTRWQIDFSKYFDKSTFFSSALNSLSSETTYKIEEISKILDTKKIYLLNFKYFLNDSTTLRGSNFFQQDLNILKNSRDLSFRLRFIEINNLNQFSSGLEKSYDKERSVRIKFRMVKEINNETEFTNKIENVYAPVNTNRSRITNSNDLQSDFSYRPYSNIEIGFLFKVSRLQDNYPETPTILDENKFNLRLTLSLLERGRLRVEFERTELSVNTDENIIPFEITNGNIIGKNYIWRTNFDFRFSGNLQANFNYSGRLQGKGKIIHTMRAEARAYF